MQEAASVLREWGQIWKKLYVVNYQIRFYHLYVSYPFDLMTLLPRLNVERSRPYGCFFYFFIALQELGTPNGDQELWDAVRKAMMDVADWRKQLITGTLTSDQIAQLKLKITRKIDWGNRQESSHLCFFYNVHMTYY